MISNKLLVIVCTVFISISSDAYANRWVNIQQIVVFGDSYSDNGNTYKISDNTYPGSAYYLGHYLNGLNWSEYFAQKIGINSKNSREFRNFAYGQAQIYGKITLKTHKLYKKKTIKRQFNVPDLNGEIQQYLLAKDINVAKTLFFVFIGTNDFLNYIPKSKQQNQLFLAKRIAVIEAQIERLKKIGAKYVVVFNIRDLKLSPLAKELAQKNGHGYLKVLDKMIGQYNYLLLKKYKHDKNVVIYDIFKFDEHIFNNNILYLWRNHRYSLLEKTTPCYKNRGSYIDKVGKICNNPWEYIFYDRIHQTTYVNKLMSDDLFLFLKRKHWRINHEI